MKPSPPAVSSLSSRTLYFRLLSQVRPYWKVFAIALLCMVLSSIIEPVFPALMKSLLDKKFDSDIASKQFIIFPATIVALFVLRGVFSFCANYAMAWVSNRVVWKLRNQMFGRLLRLPTTFYDNNSSGQIVSRLVYDVDSVVGAATSVMTILVRDTITVVGLLVWMLYVNWKLAMITIVMLPFVAVIARQFSGRLRKMARLSQSAMGNIAHVIEESLGAHKIIKVYGSQRYEENRFDRANRHHRGYSMRSQIAAGLATPFVQIFASFALAIIVGIALYQAAHQQTSIGGFISFVVAMMMMMPSIRRITDANVPLQRGLAGAESVFSMVDEEQELDQGQTILPDVRGEIEFSAVTFTYEGAARCALEEVSFFLPAGKTFALVGASGGGKTTIANLIPRFYNVQQGRILLDGHDVSTVTLASLRSHIAMVNQDVVLFNDTVANNIAYGAGETVSREAIEEAAQHAHATEFIAHLPQGFETEIGEKGVKLSGGQRQRIAIARALLKNAPILILDEATSALDTASERAVQAALENLMSSRTTLVIAHRLSTVERADQILVLDRGRIVERGTHQELIRQARVYTKLYQMQFADHAQGG